MLVYWRFLLRKYIKSERGTSFIEYIFVIAAIISTAYALFFTYNKGDKTLGEILAAKFKAAIGKIPTN